jgi:lipopolysaccharide biosynthesis protein/SAM-dependent methyltransferase
MVLRKNKDMFNDLDNTSYGKLLAQIEPGSHVLEFGAGQGFMTKLMKERLDCRVYILEADKEGYDEAFHYAYDGYCGDIEQYEWEDRIELASFDAIVFADALERLYNPQEVLSRARQYLKDDGVALVSLSNIAHVDVLANLFENTLTHTENGVLDNTHIRFFAYRNLEGFMHSCGFDIDYETYTVAPIFSTEQGAIISKDRISELGSLFFNHVLGDIRQFVLVVRKMDMLPKPCPAERSEILQRIERWNAPKLYLDTGDGFTEENTLSLKTDSLKHQVSKRIILPAGVKGIRFDPVDGGGCLLRGFQAKCEGHILEIESTNGILLANGDYLFQTDDPRVVLGIKEGIASIDLQYSIDTYLLGDNSSVVPCLLDLSSLVDAKSSELLEAARRLAAFQSTIERIQSEASELSAVQAATIARLETSIVSLKKSVQAKDRTIQAKDRVIHAKDQAIQIQEQAIRAKDQAIEEIRSSTSWKVTKPLRFLSAVLQRKPKIVPIEQIPEQQSEPVAREPRREDPSPQSSQSPKKHNPYPLAFDCEYQEFTDYSQKDTFVKVVAFYLPQFHIIPENNMWWGDGFTEWTNTRKAIPRFENHYQPREPHNDIGYYDLSDVETLKKQVELAKSHGIFGFCFYLYWFSGKRLLEKPLDILFEHPEIEMDYCLCWANENWTRVWNGLDKQVLIKQEYTEDDPLALIDEVKKYLADKRYIRDKGRPVLLIYNPADIENIAAVVAKWRARAKEVGIGEISLWVCKRTFARRPWIEEGLFDAEIEFPPHAVKVDQRIRVARDKGKGTIYFYDEAVQNKIAEIEKAASGDTGMPTYRTLMMGWDNSSRRFDGWRLYAGFSLKSFYEWATAVVHEALRKNKEYVFVNAWNEWAEGTYLEPDRKYGYAVINTLAKAIKGIPLKGEVKALGAGFEVTLVNAPKIAVQIHIYHLEMLQDMLEYTNNIPYSYDCFITTDTEDKRQCIATAFRDKSRAANVTVQVFENRGRDVAPMIFQMSPVIDEYDFLLHIHTKGTVHYADGNEWRGYLMNNLLGDRGVVTDILGEFMKNPHLGLIFPETFEPIAQREVWAHNKENAVVLLRRLSIDLELGNDVTFPTGNMLWMRTAAVRQLFDAGLRPADFQEEDGQKDATMAHAVERSWVYIARANDYGYLRIRRG